VGVLTIVLDTAILNVALPSIRAEIHFAEASLVWAVNAYMLTFGKGRCRRRSDQRPLSFAARKVLSRCNCRPATLRSFLPTKPTPLPILRAEISRDGNGSGTPIVTDKSRKNQRSTARLRKISECGGSLDWRKAADYNQR
jgi:hypothetical protein